MENASKALIIAGAILLSILLISLGKAVEEVLIKLKEDGVIKEEQILMGFPHPSGANVNRVTQFESNKDNMIKFIKRYFN